MRNSLFGLIVVLLMSGCYGSFKLTKNVYEMNDEVSENGFVKSAVMVGMIAIPVYPIACVADLLVFNSLEFWTGENPIAMEAGEQRRQLIEANGTTYRIDAQRDRVEITDMNGAEQGVHTVHTLIYNRQQGIWEVEE